MSAKWSKKDIRTFMIASLILLVWMFLKTHVIDLTALTYMRKRNTWNPAVIQNISEYYVESCGITIDKPIKYEFVKYRDMDKAKKPTDEVTFGTFHEWNGTYYICIADEIKESALIQYVVIHETRHMMVDYLKDEGVIDLDKYTEEIAESNNIFYNNVFDSSVDLLEFMQSKEDK